jgi:hypothetical protein
MFASRSMSSASRRVNRPASGGAAMVTLLLVTLALVFMVGSIMGKLPLWPAVLCLALLHLLQYGGVR